MMMDLSQLLDEDVELEESIAQELSNVDLTENEVPEVKVEVEVPEVKVENEKVPETKEVPEVEAPTSVETEKVPKVKETPKVAEKAKKPTGAKADKDFVDTIGIQMPSDDKYLKNLQSYTWIEDPMDGEIKIYRIDKDSTYEKRTKYRYLAPEMIEGIVGDVLSFTELGGSFVYTTVSETGVILTINESITGYYPAVMSITKGAESVNIKIKHTAKYITGLVDLITTMIDEKLDETTSLKDIFKQYLVI